MAQTIKLKRSAVAGRIPNVSDLELGEIAINTYDGKMYIKKSVNGEESISEIGQDASLGAVFTSYTFTATANQTVFTGNDNSGSALDIVDEFSNVFMNGILLDPEIDFTVSSDGLTLTLTEPAEADDILQINSFDQAIFNGTLNVDALALTGMAGEMVWNSDEETIDVPLNDDVTLQLGQEFVFRGKATEAISNGDVVMFAGAQGGHLLIAKANMSAAGFAPEHVIGIATQDFSTNDFGFVTELGKVRGLDTSGYSEGTILYLDPTTAGALTATKPTPPNHAIQMCAVVNSHGTQGTLLVRPTHMTDTDEVAEGSSNLYFTVARAVAAIKADGAWNASDWDTAYSWGNHASAGYLTTHQDISGKANLSGATFTGNVIVDGGVGVNSSGTFHVRQKGNTVNDGIAITSSNATAHRIWKDSSGVLNFGVSSNGDQFGIDTSGNLKVNGTNIIDNTRNATFVGGTFTGNVDVVGDGDTFTLRSTGDITGHVGMQFTSQGASATQIGHIRYSHRDANSYGNTESFTIGGTEATTAILADGNFLYRDGIYKKPATGTGAGTRKDTNWDTAYTYSQVGHLPLSGGTLTGDLTVNGNIHATGAGATTNNDQYHFDGAGAVLRVGPYYTSGGDRDAILLKAGGELSVLESNNENFKIVNASGNILINPTNNNVNIETGNFQLGGTTVIDSARNLTNIGTISTSGSINGTKTKAKSVASLSAGTYYYLCSTLSSYNGDSSSANVTIYATGANDVVEASIVVKNAGGVSIPAVRVKSTTITGLSIVAEKQSGSDDIIHFYVKTSSNIAYTPRIVVTDLIRGEFQATEPTLSTEEYTWSCDAVNSANIKVSGSVHINDDNASNDYLRLNKGLSGDGGILFEIDNSLKWQNVQRDDGGLQWYSYSRAATNVIFNGLGDIELHAGDYKIGTTTVIDSSRNIVNVPNAGIGVSTPERALHVNSGSVNEAARFESTDTACKVEFKDLTGTASIETRDDFRFNTGGVLNRVIISRDGYVGIRTTTPNYQMQIMNVSGTPGFAVTRSTDFNNPLVKINTDSTKNFIASNGDLLLSTTTTGNENYLERLRVTETGNVGVGASNPLRKLHVVGNFAVNNSTSEYYGVNIAGGEGADPFITIGDWHNAGAKIWWDSSQRALKVDTQYGTNPGTFKLTGNDGADTFLEVSNTGNIGIGTSGIYQRLTVSGIIEAGDAATVGGGVGLTLPYNGSTNDYTVNYGGMYSSGGVLIGYGVRSSTDTPNTYTSTYDNFSGVKAALRMDDALRFLASGSATHTRGDPVPMTERFTVKSNGNVGLGITNPFNRFEIQSAYNNAIVLHDNRTATSGTYRHGIKFNHYNSYANGIYFEHNDYFGIARDACVIEVGNSEKFRISYQGKVGIGLGGSTPAAKLTIQGSSGYTVANSGKAIEGIDVNATAGGTNLGGGAISFGVGGAGRASIAAIQGTGDGDNTELAFNVHGSTSAHDAIEVVRVSSDSRVGINTQSPEQALHVAGAVKVNSAAHSSTINGGLVIDGPAYQEYQFNWNGLTSHTITMTTGSYFMAEVVYTAHQTNSGTDYNEYRRGKWANNYTTHIWEEFENSGNIGAMDTSFTVSENTVPNSGKLVIQENYIAASYSRSTLTVRVYYGSFAITKS